MLLKPGVENLEYPFMFEGIDKILHLSIFALLGFTFLAAFPKIKFPTFIQIMIIYGLLTEILQDEMHLGRSLEGRLYHFQKTCPYYDIVYFILIRFRSCLFIIGLLFFLVFFFVCLSFFISQAGFFAVFWLAH